jgi:hypothetical protein
MKSIPPSAMIESTSIAGAGFINITLSKKWIAEVIKLAFYERLYSHDHIQTLQHGTNRNTLERINVFVRHYTCFYGGLSMCMTMIIKVSGHGYVILCRHTFYYGVVDINDNHDHHFIQEMYRWGN